MFTLVYISIQHYVISAQQDVERRQSLHSMLPNQTLSRIASENERRKSLGGRQPFCFSNISVFFFSFLSPLPLFIRASSSKPHHSIVRSCDTIMVSHFFIRCHVHTILRLIILLKNSAFFTFQHYWNQASRVKLSSNHLHEPVYLFLYFLST